jgi:ribosome-associated protein
VSYNTSGLLSVRLGRTRWEVTLEALQLAREIADLVVGELALDTRLLDVREVTLIADYFVICSGNSDRHVQALTEKVREQLAKKGLRPFGAEGEAASGWILLDYTDVILHVFTPTVRRFYDLEGFWNQAKTILRVE